MESAEEILRHLAPFTISVHLKDFAVERLEYLMGFTFRGKPTGQGILRSKRNRSPSPARGSSATAN
jgi:hypothetical protein